MIAARQLLHELTISLRNVIAPAIQEPYPKAQAHMAAVILDFVSRQVEERPEIELQKQAALAALLSDLIRWPEVLEMAANDQQGEAHLCRLIEQLYESRDRLGEEVFAAANQRIRQGLRQMLDQELKVAKAE
jgi:hypothetical protein